MGARRGLVGFALTHTSLRGVKRRAVSGVVLTKPGAIHLLNFLARGIVMINKLILIIGLVGAVNLYCADEEIKSVGNGVRQVGRINGRCGYVHPQPKEVADATTNYLLSEYLKVWPELERLQGICDQKSQAYEDFLKPEFDADRDYGRLAGLCVAIVRSPWECWYVSRGNTARRNYQRYDAEYTAIWGQKIIDDLESKGCLYPDIKRFIDVKCAEPWIKDVAN